MSDLSTHPAVPPRWPRFFCAFAIVLHAVSSYAELIPPSRLANWASGIQVGVPGGIDQYRPGGTKARTKLIDVTQEPYFADKSGATDAQNAIQTAINAAGNGEVVWIPAGNYRLNKALRVGAKDNITIRGEGPTRTILNLNITSGFQGIVVGTDADYLWNYPDYPITGSPSKGSTVLNVGSTSALESYPNGGIGAMVHVSVLNDTTLPVVHVSGYQRVRHFKALVKAKTSNTITIFPPIPFDLPVNLEPRFAAAGTASVAENVGLEDFAVNGANMTVGGVLVSFLQTIGCWANNVHVTNTRNFHLSLADSLLNEVRKCDLRSRNVAGSNGAALLMNSSSSCLIEDNIMVDNFPLIEVNSGSTGNVIAYNFCAQTIGVAIDTNHGPHSSFNLYEGNVTPNFQCDGYFGGASEDTIFRNWIHGRKGAITSLKPAEGPGLCLNFNRFTRNYNVVGNVIGWPGVTSYSYPGPMTSSDWGMPYIGSFDHLGTVEPSKGVWWAVWDGRAMVRRGAFKADAAYSNTNSSRDVVDHVGTSSKDTNGGTILQWIADNPAKNGLSTWDTPGTSDDWRPLSANSFRELDKDVFNTLLLKANYRTDLNEISVGEALVAETLPDSLFRREKPAWFGDLAWPPFSPNSPVNASYDDIPAGYRYLNGGSDAPGQPDVPPPAIMEPRSPSNLRIKNR